jgi:hypothetical protein
MTGAPPYGFAMGVRRARRATGVFGGEPVRLIAPAGDDPALARWAEVPSGELITLAMPGRRQGRNIAQAAELTSYGEELVRLVLHPESKMLGLDGGTCRARTKGLLLPRPVRVAAVHLVGKEGNRLEEVALGEVTDPDEVLIDYGDDAWEAVVLPILRSVTVTTVALRVRMDRTGLSDYLRARSPRRPTAPTQARLREIAGSLLRDGVARKCAVPGCTAWARPLPSSTCSESHRRSIRRRSVVVRHQPTCSATASTSWSGRSLRASRYMRVDVAVQVLSRANNSKKLIRRRPGRHKVRIAHRGRRNHRAYLGAVE